MIDHDPNTANAYVTYRAERLATHQVNLHRKDHKTAKAGLNLWKRIFR